MCVCVYCYEFREFFRHWENKQPSGIPMCKPLKHLIYFPVIQSHIHKKKKKEIKKVDISSAKPQFSRNEDEYNPKL